jgi:hypothetical protein
MVIAPCIWSFEWQANGLRYLRWGGDGEARPTGKMKRRRKLLEICAESPASDARFVGQFYGKQLSTKL